MIKFVRKAFSVLIILQIVEDAESKSQSDISLLKISATFLK